MKNHNDLFLLAMCTMCNCLAQIGLFSAQEKMFLMTLPKRGGGHSVTLADLWLFFLSHTN